ncbi:NTP transferase domain-containing protein, partial [bacterium]|nr:NTP transferase domain-containing protein [bacterium]
AGVGGGAAPGGRWAPRPERAPPPGAAVPAGVVDAWILHPAGGGTAATCLAAVGGLDGRASHLWFHPVDLPLVAEATLRTLADLSRDDPEKILVPRHAGGRGHPVISPLSPWRGLSPADHPGDMKGLIDRCETGFRYADVPDPGIRRDFDDPEDLAGPA